MMSLYIIPTTILGRKIHGMMFKSFIATIRKTKLVQRVNSFMISTALLMRVKEDLMFCYCWDIQVFVSGAAYFQKIAGSSSIWTVWNGNALNFQNPFKNSLSMLKNWLSNSATIILLTHLRFRPI